VDEEDDDAMQPKSSGRPREGPSLPQLADVIQASCDFFNGIRHHTCRRGIVYDDVFDLSAPLERVPCTDGTGCPSARFPTRAEAETLAGDILVRFEVLHRHGPPRFG